MPRLTQLFIESAAVSIKIYFILFVLGFTMEKNGDELTFTDNEKSLGDAKRLLGDLWTRIKGD